MYRSRTKGYSKADQAKRWALPDRVFFDCGACHILAYAFLQRYGTPTMKVLWIKPKAGHTGNHIFVAGGAWAFDYHGYPSREQLLTHNFRRARHCWPGWDATLVELPAEILISEEKSRQIDGLWLREPKQFLQDALPRANAFLARFPAPPREA